MNEKRYLERDKVVQYFVNKGWIGTINAMKSFPSKSASEIIDDAYATVDYTVSCGTTFTGATVSATTIGNTTGGVINDYTLRVQETNMSENTSAVSIKTITYVEIPGVMPLTDVRNLTPATLSSIISKIEKQISDLDKIEIKPKRVTKHIDALRQGLKDLVAAVDAADEKAEKDQA